MASENGHKEMVESLLSLGADVNHQEKVCDIYGVVMNDVLTIFL